MSCRGGPFPQRMPVYHAPPPFQRRKWGKVWPARYVPGVRSDWGGMDTARPLNFCPSCHYEERSDEVISWFIKWLWDCFVGLWPPRNDKWRVFQRSHSDKSLEYPLPKTHLRICNAAECRTSGGSGEVRPAGETGAGERARQRDVGEIDGLIEERKNARQAKDWKRADELRRILAEKKILILDSPAGTTWKME